MKRRECMLRMSGCDLALSRIARCSVGPTEYHVGASSPSHSDRSTFEGLAGKATLPPVSSGVSSVILTPLE